MNHKHNRINIFKSEHTEHNVEFKVIYGYICSGAVYLLLQNEKLKNWTTRKFVH